MHNDDLPVGRILGRREILTLFGTSTVALLAGCMPLSARRGAGRAGGGPGGSAPIAETTSLCIVSPEQTEGPYFSDVQLNRADIRSDPSDGSLRAGVPLELTLNLNHVTADNCTPFAGAIVDIWHCDAAGVYSDFAAENSAGQKFLRGYQVSDERGIVRFTTIYPGWYDGRTVHIHLKVRTDTAAGQSYEFTSQIYFDDAMTDRVYARAPYSDRPNRTTHNANDGIYGGEGERINVEITEEADGYAGTLDIGLFMS